MDKGGTTPDLTSRERDVLALIVRGCTDKEIGFRLGISHGTLRTHISSLYAKFGVTNRASVVTKWHRISRARRSALSHKR